MSNEIIIVPFRHIDSAIISHLFQELNFAYNSTIRIKESQAIPRLALNQYRGQYRANFFLDALTSLNFSARTLGITDVDLYNDRHDYVFGATDPERMVALISLTRLNPGFYKMLEDIRTYYSRITKAAIYHLGFLFNLNKCPEEDCVMHPAETILELDLKSERFCGNCQAKLKEFWAKSK
ncbi:MAG: hypothetical protein ABIK10_05210 [candidate division WOR-3 bacterium]